ncbi:DUF2218 domain-containing protein [Streptomyces odontomachi]|uniref:DUF2218 domain-containing protein n=1 Tax=Streptomyces odontomachi TaxID=2944940 RepID=UPI00210DAA53|nr:DUF2218 domain-containing protein [Streptomyces sp. ODS25]
MLSAEARVATDRPSRYLVQLCRHIDHMRGQLHREAPAHGDGDAAFTVRQAEWADDQGLVDFGWGRCIMRAGPGELVLHVEADDEDGLRRIQEGIARRLETIGRRDAVQVHWQQADDGRQAHTPPALPRDAAASTPEGRTTRHRPRLGAVGLAAVVVLALSVHLGLLEALLGQARWAGWAADVVVVLVVVKILVVGRFAVLRSRRSKARLR